ncbi:NAD-dependent DNA ligase LigA [Acholeplasma hippikon]|uniref:DNA ligase n=1 Tax=Acholeplasma hippikon TaxID=264636 RepID=A0A449BKV7_9MOLU|nr:NAD-dependent DNA ligase LigA [Acholeplasma hippikon]VEU83098.1 DNA ligase (NAD(+)) [Acholeplasma hippikon]
MIIKDRILELRKMINEANIAYHTEDKPLISDFEYDMMLKELNELEEQYPEYDDPNSPTKKIGGGILDEFQKHTHSTPMMSLGNVFNEEELRGFYNKVNKVVDNFSIVSELKIDGLAVSLIYEQGKFIKAATRGNGLVGEDVTQNVRTIKSLPLTLKEPIDIEVRGEIYMSHASFKKANVERLEQGLDLFANPRNAAAGTIRQLDSKVVAKRDLSIFLYAIVNAKQYVQTQEELLKYLKHLGFPVNPYFKVAKNADELISYISEYDDLRKTLPYDTDGIVVKVNELSLHEMIGYTAKSPKFATAYKFEAEKQETVIKGIAFQVGRTGVITPVAELEPVLISGSMVSRATLHNEDYVLGKDIRINDYVLVHKAGEIIPEVLSVNLDKRTNQEPFKMIDTCPVCGSHLERKSGEADYYCMNENCTGKNVFSLIHFASRVAMDIESLGEKVVLLLHDLTYLQTIPDIYKLHLYKDELMELPGFGKKKVENLLDAIEKSKTQTFDRFIFGLGIKHVGAKVAKLLLKHFPTIDDLMNASFEALIDIHEIGEQIASSVVQYFSNEKNIEMINELRSFGINMAYQVQTTKDHEFSGKTFVLTGTLESFSRDQASSIIEKLGGKVSSSVSSKTNYLLAGSDAGSKLRKAQDLGVYVMSEEEFKEKTNE